MYCCIAEFSFLIEYLTFLFSISWLLYLSDPRWTEIENGGSLRCFPQAGTIFRSPCGSHEGNIQVGWLISEPELGDIASSNSRKVPVYLDCWMQSSELKKSGLFASAMYIIREKSVSKILKKSTERQYITNLFDVHDRQLAAIQKRTSRLTYTAASASASDSDSAVSMPLSFSFADKTMSSESTRLKLERGECFVSAEDFIDPRNSAKFILIEDNDLWADGGIPEGSFIEDIEPKSGRLVLFDSVSLPHEVMITKAGERLALAGWFHEKQQSFPLMI